MEMAASPINKPGNGSHGTNNNNNGHRQPSTTINNPSVAIPTTTQQQQPPTMANTRSQKRQTRSGGQKAPVPAKKAMAPKRGAQTGLKARRGKAASDEEVVELVNVDRGEGPKSKKKRRTNKYVPPPFFFPFFSLTLPLPPSRKTSVQRAREDIAADAAGPPAKQSV
jgi:hypothetical protein